MISVRWIVLLICLLLCLVVGLQNMEPVDIRVLFWQIVEVPKLYFMAGAFLVGFFLGGLAYALTRWSLERKRRIPMPTSNTHREDPPRSS